MQIRTTRFGNVPIDAEDVLHFPQGLIGLESHRHWILLADAENEALAWLQSTTAQDLALAVISPRRFLPDYRVHLSERDLVAIGLEQLEQAFVLNVVSHHEEGLTANLRAPLLFNLERRLGRQVVTTDEQPLQWKLTVPPLKILKSA